MRTFQNIGSTSTNSPVPELIRHLRRNLSTPRFEHTLRVAATAQRLCRRHGLDRALGQLAGLGHDLAREWPAARLLSAAQEAGWQPSELERETPLLLHGPVAAAVLTNRFHVRNPDVLESVRHHTLGRAGLSPLARALFVADYVEPGRTYLTREFRERVVSLPLDEAVCAVIEDSATRWGDLAEPTRALYDEIRAEMAV